MEFSHIPVLLNQTIEGLNVNPNGISRPVRQKMLFTDFGFSCCIVSPIKTALNVSRAVLLHRMTDVLSRFCR